MGVGTPDDILEAVERGIDMFDCVLATRLARHGTFWDLDGTHHLRNARYREDESPLCDWVEHYSSREFSKSYVYHLHREKELLAIRLLSLHNIAFVSADEGNPLSYPRRKLPELQKRFPHTLSRQ